MINVQGNEWIPSEGYKYLANGEVYSERIFLGRNDNIANWHDTNDEPPEPEDDIPPEDALSILMGGAT